MSDSWITLIPEDPCFVPAVAEQELARNWFAKLAPEADRIEIRLTEKIEFFDCRENFERIICPRCRSEVSIEWWQDRMNEDYDDGFTLGRFALPCCAADVTLHELDYDWPQGFGRFALEAMNPQLGMLDHKSKQAFEEILGTKLRVIHQHI